MTIDAWFEFGRPVWEKDTMSKTADKIKVMLVFVVTVPAAKADCRLLEEKPTPLAQLFTEIADYKVEMEQHIKTPDPEPLECWAAVYSDRSVKCFMDSKEAAQLLSPPENSPVHMREVTPQMEQNELDARRYRWWKHHFPVPNSDFGDPGEWDDIADKAMGK